MLPHEQTEEVRRELEAARETINRFLAALDRLTSSHTSPETETDPEPELGPPDGRRFVYEPGAKEKISDEFRKIIQRAKDYPPPNPKPEPPAETECPFQVGSLITLRSFFHRRSCPVIGVIERDPVNSKLSIRSIHDRQLITGTPSWSIWRPTTRQDKMDWAHSRPHDAADLIDRMYEQD